MTTETKTTDPRVTVPESAGRLRPLSDVKPDWWLYLKPAVEGVQGEWAQVKWFAETNLGNMMVAFVQDSTDGDGNGTRAHKSTEVRMLTMREAKTVGLTGRER